MSSLRDSTNDVKNRYGYNSEKGFAGSSAPQTMHKTHLWIKHDTDEGRACRKKLYPLLDPTPRACSY